MCDRSGENGERPWVTCHDDPEGIDDRDAEDEERDGDLGGAQHGEHRQRVPDELHARAREDRGWVKVPAQEPEQRAGERETEDRDQRLPDLRREADQADRHGGDERHARTTGRPGRRSS